MKLRNLLLCGICALSTTFVSAQTTFPFTLTTADGLPEQTSEAAKAFSKWVSPTYTFDEEVTSFRLTVTHTSWQDAYNTSTNGGRGYIFFTMGEFYLYDAAGNQVELTADNFYGNATESPGTNDGVIGNLCDGDEGTHYHTMYSATEEPRPIGQEYYLEVTLPQPMKSFSFGFAKRSNNANIPSEIIVTKGGEDADPYADFGFQLGEKVETIEGGGLYVFADEGKINTENWGENNGMTTYLATGRDPRYASPAGTDKYYRLRRKANVDCIFKAEAAGEGEFYLKSFLGESYIKSYAASDGSVFVEQATSFAEAAKFHLDEEGYLVCNNHYYATNSQETLVAYDHAVRVMTIFKASVGGEIALKDLQNAITDAENALAEYKEKVAAGDDGETAALEAAVAAAKALTAESPSDEIFAAAQDLNTATSAFLKLMIYTFVDEIQEILDDEDIQFGTELGMYPVAQKNILEETLNQLMYDLDNREFTSFEDTKQYVEKVQKKLDDFRASKLDTPTELPIHLIGENGAVVFEKMEGLGNYIYTSPTIFLPEPIDKIYLTFVKTNNGDHSGGWPCTNWAHFTLRDENGETVELMPEDFYTNALEPGNDGQGYPGICDYDENGDPDLKTYLHTLYSEKDVTTNEHYLCVTFPEPMSIFSFDLISRDNGRLVPTEMVIDTVPYHWLPTEEIELKNQITSLDELDPNKYYILYGNLARLEDGTQVSEGTGFYDKISALYPDYHQPAGVFRIEPADEEGGYYIHYLIDDVYLGNPTSWQGGFTADSKEEAGVWHFEESGNLADGFKIYTNGLYSGDCKNLTFTDEPVRYVAQDWGLGSDMGFYCVVPRAADDDGNVTEAQTPWDFDDTDGESDWFIYETEAPVYKVFVSQISKAAQLNTSNQFALFGNLGKLNSKAGSPGGFYNDVTAVGADATNYSLFRLEEGKEGTYKVHFVDSDLYLKSPTAWAGMETTTDPAEAGEFIFAESDNLAGAFKIYLTGTFDKDGTPVTGYNMLQDWGDGNGMGSYPIASFADDDTDGESDWYIYMLGDPDEIEIFREDYLGAWTYTWNNYWTPAEIVSFDFNFEADPDDPNGIIMDSFNVDDDKIENSWKGTFDGKAHTITFAPGQNIWSGHERWDAVVMIVGDDAYEKDIVFDIDLLNDLITFKGQVGVQYVAREEGGENGGWWMISSSWVKLLRATHVDQPVVDNKADAEVVNVSFYTVGGQAIAEPAKGVNIVRTVLSDGTVKTAKVLIR